MATGPSCDSGGTALQAVVRVNGLSSTLTASSLSDPSWSVVECVTDDGAVEEKIFWLPLVMDMDGSATAEVSVRTLLVYPNALKLQVEILKSQLATQCTMSNHCQADF